MVISNTLEKDQIIKNYIALTFNLNFLHILMELFPKQK